MLEDAPDGVVLELAAAGLDAQCWLSMPMFLSSRLSRESLSELSGFDVAASAAGAGVVSALRSA